jgi:hypothetical protein
VKAGVCCQEKEELTIIEKKSKIYKLSRRLLSAASKKKNTGVSGHV